MFRTIFPMLLIAMLLVASCAGKQDKELARSFSFQMHFTYPAPPEVVYDHLTGDISGWWDHSFSENPDSLYIEAWPGGGFYEIFDARGDGVKHATVIFAKRGEMLRMEGPLGLSGQALNMVCTYELEADGEQGTQLTLDVHGSGRYPDGSPEIIQTVWEHFLWEQFRPYLEEKIGK